MQNQRFPIVLPTDSVEFPDVEWALNDPNGLLAVGGDLEPERLLSAYRHGIFPWYSEGQPILWWSPDPRAVLMLDDLKCSRSLKKSLRSAGFSNSIDQAFNDVITSCAQVPRRDQDGTWISPAMQTAYIDLHRAGHAHSIETWHEGQLVGGLYGLAIGPFFFGESMFSLRTDASKVALYFLTEHLKKFDFCLIDCQVPNPHLASLGVKAMKRREFIQILSKHIDRQVPSAVWQ